MAIVDKLIDIAIAVIIYFSIFAAVVTSVALTNWTALGLSWVPTIIYILLAVIPVLALVYELRMHKK